MLLLILHAIAQEMLFDYHHLILVVAILFLIFDLTRPITAHFRITGNKKGHVGVKEQGKTIIYTISVVDYC